MEMTPLAVSATKNSIHHHCACGGGASNSLSMDRHYIHPGPSLLHFNSIWPKWIKHLKYLRAFSFVWLLFVCLFWWIGKQHKKIKPLSKQPVIDLNPQKFVTDLAHICTASRATIGYFQVQHWCRGISLETSRWLVLMAERVGSLQNKLKRKLHWHSVSSLRKSKLR